MKILIVMDEFQDANNGTTISARRFANELQKRGHEVKTISVGDTTSSNYGVKPRSFGKIGNKIIHSQGMVLALPDENIIKEALSWSDIVHLYIPFKLEKETMKYAIKMHKPMTTAFHVQPENISYNIGLGKVKFVNDFIYKYFRDTYYKYFRHIHCPSKFIANRLVEHGYKAKIHVISNGVDDAFKVNKVDKPDKFKDKIVITMVGRLSPEKRQDLLIDAVDKSKYKDKIQLIFCGQGPKKESLEKRAAKLKNSPIFAFYPKDKLINILDYTDIYVHASDAEIEAISCLEAIATGLVPIIANSNESATPQFALDDRSLFKKGNSSDLAKKIDYWIENYDERKRMELLYAKEVEDNYRIGKSIEKIEEMFNEEIEDME